MSRYESASLPRLFEDYEDNDYHVLHKSLQRDDHSIKAVWPLAHLPLHDWLSQADPESRQSMLDHVNPGAHSNPGGQAWLSSQREVQHEMHLSRSTQQWLTDILQHAELEDDSFEFVRTTADCYSSELLVVNVEFCSYWQVKVASVATGRSR